MKILEFNAELGKKIGCSFVIQNDYSPVWARVFVRDGRGVSIGRITFKDGKVWYPKFYKRWYIKEVGPEDFIWLRLERYINDGVIITDEQFKLLVKEAIAIREKDLKQKQAWRDANPVESVSYNKKYKMYTPKKRKKLEGKGVREILEKLALRPGWYDAIKFV